MVSSNGMFVNNETNSYETYSSSSSNGGKHFIISPKPRIAVEFRFCELNEKRVSTFRNKFNCFTNDSYDLNVVWKTKKVRSFFPLKDKNLHPSCKIYYGLCSCGEETLFQLEDFM